jgi:hypothetical protein
MTFWNLRAGDGGDVAGTAATVPEIETQSVRRRLLTSAKRRRRLAAKKPDISKAGLQLPPCDFGPLLNFVGNFTGCECSEAGWLVGGLPAGMPDLHQAQVAARKNATRHA